MTLPFLYWDSVSIFCNRGDSDAHFVGLLWILNRKCSKRTDKNELSFSNSYSSRLCGSFLGSSSTQFFLVNSGLSWTLSLCSPRSPCSDCTRHHQPFHRQGNRFMEVDMIARGVKYSLKTSIPGLGSATRTDVSTHEFVDMPTEKPTPGDRWGSWPSRLGAPGMSPNLATYWRITPDKALDHSAYVSSFTKWD